jgi:sialate O-acetylesterase
MPAGGPYDLTVAAGTKLTFHDILLGEVWLASGQSNMEFKMMTVKNAATELAAANHPNLRMFNVPNTALPAPTTQLAGKWELSTPAAATHFIAVGYYFAVNLFNDLHVPIGIINSTVGGTPAEAWTPLPGLTADPLFAAPALKELQALNDLQANRLLYVANLAAWEKQYNAAEPEETEPLPDPTAAVWKPLTVPGDAKNLPFTGPTVLWAKVNFELKPSDLTPNGARADLGYLLESDTVYVNGTKIGHSAADPLHAASVYRAYNIPPPALHVGSNTILVRAFAHSSLHQTFGINGMTVTVLNGTNGPLIRYPIQDGWQYIIGSQVALTPAALAELPQPPQVSPGHTASALYNGMIAPLGDFALRGALWYQGESNAGAADRYAALMTHLIAGWRAQWHDDFPFYIVQLPIYANTNFPAMRAAQAQIAALVPNTAIAVTIDTGEVQNIHPIDKKPVGDRLALLARHRVYGESLEDSGPFFASAETKDGSLRIHLTHAMGLHSTSETIANFEIAGPDHHFLPATAILDGETILLSSPAVPHPVSARYAWTASPLNCSLYNQANLPLAPFTTDPTPH